MRTRIEAGRHFSKLRTRFARTGSVICLLLIFAGHEVAPALADDIPATDDLARLGQASRQLGIPAVVFVSRDACPYCRTLRDDILLPMQRADKFDDRAILVEISLDRAGPITGFDGSPTTAQAFGEHYRAQITPTLLFLDPEGNEISRRIVGISNLELYGHYLQKSIDTALEAIRSGSPEG